MKILVSNDDGYKAKGLKVLVELLLPYGEITVIAPKYHQSCTSMSVSMGLKPIAVRELRGEEVPEGCRAARWFYLDGTPASCIKYAVDEVFTDGLPDLLVTGINHGSNAASAALYSGTLGAAGEGALAGIPSIGFSLDNMGSEADFSEMSKLFPAVFERLLANMTDRFGAYYNVNFPDIPASRIRGLRVCSQGIQHWVREFRDYDAAVFDRRGTTPKEMGIWGMPEVEPGEKVFLMVGDLTDDPRNTLSADHLSLAEGDVTLTVHNIDATDYAEMERLKAGGFETEFKKQ